MIRIEIIAETPAEAAEVVDRLRDLRIPSQHIDRGRVLSLVPRDENAS